MSVTEPSRPTTTRFLHEVTSFGDDSTVPEIDIVAVHGLNPRGSTDHAFSTWTAANGSLWLKDLLPTEIPNARILVYSYNSSAVFHASQQGIEGEARELMDRVLYRREGHEKRPLLFICHSLGGLVVKRAMVLGKGQVDRFRALRNATYGIIFFGTPHYGGNYAEYGNVASKIARAVFGSTTNNLIEVLRKDSYLANVGRTDFQDGFEDFRYVTFFEGLSTPRLGKIVDMESAILKTTTDRQVVHELEKTHADICRFATADDPDFYVVWKSIRKLSLDAVAAERVHESLAALADVPDGLRHLDVTEQLFSRSQYRDYGAASLSKHFTGRDILLQEMEDRFFRGEKIQDSSKIIVLHGPGGIGKSQIAQRYARSKESHYDFVCVVSCESRQAVERALTDFAINVLRDPPSEQSACLSRLRIGLSECKKSWLFVFDGYDSASRGSADWFSIDRYFPTPPIGITGHILITSVYEGASDMGEGLMIATFSPREARELLLSVSGLADAGVREEDIDEICNQLGRIPLAVDVAGSYLRQQHKGGLFLGREQSLLKTYRHHFNTAGDEFKSFLFSDLVSMPSGNYSYYRTVYKAWKLSFDGVRSINTAAADLFLLLSFLDPKVVSSESAYVRSAFASRPVWNLDGKIEILKPGYRTLPAWLCTLVGSQEVSDDGELGIGSVSIQSATDLLASYSMMRKMIHFGNGYEVWTSHGVFWDCARIYCNQNMTTEMSSTAIDLLLYNRGGVVTSSALFRPDEYISVSSWFLLETILADHIFLPCKTIIGEICDWDKILKSLAAALPSKHATDINLNMLEVRDGLAFLAVTIGHRLEGLDFSSVDISACKAGAAALRDSVFTINALSVLYLLYRIEYLTSGRGLNNPNQEPSELVGFEEISLLLNELKTPDVLESWDTVNGLLLIGTLLVALHRLFVFNETDDNPSLIWKSDTVQKLRQRWLDLRHTTILRKYASKTERHIMQLRGSELLRRARARLFITFARELDKIPRHSFEVSTAFSQVRRKYSEFLAEDILFLNILALHDLEEIGIHHLCALGGSTYLAFDFCGFLFRLEAKRPKFREEAKDKLKSQLDAVSRCIGREIQIELLQELVTNFISPRSAAMHRNCVGCNRVWTSYNLDIQHQSVEAGATLLVSTWRRNMISLLRKALEIVQNLNRALDRYETSAKVVQYTDREQVEKVIDKFKEQYQKLFRKLDFGHFLCNFAAAIEADRHELLSDISSTGLTDVDKAQVELYRDEVEHQLQDLGPIETEELTIALKNAMTRLGMSLEEFLEDRHDSQLLTKGFLEHFEKSLSGQNLSTRFAWLSRRTKNRRSGLRLLTESSNRHMSTLVALESSTSTQAEMDALTAERTARLDKLTVWHNFERAGYLVDFITQKLDLSGIVG